MFQKKGKTFFFIETKSRIHRLSCHFRSNLWVMEHFRKVHRFLLNVKTVIKDIFFMRYLKVFVIKNGDDFIRQSIRLTFGMRDETVSSGFVLFNFVLFLNYLSGSKVLVTLILLCQVAKPSSRKSQEVLSIH